MTSCNPVEEVVVDFWFEEEAKDGDKTIHAFALDGRILLITKPNPTKLAELKKASDESKQGEQLDYSEWLLTKRKQNPRLFLKYRLYSEPVSPIVFAADQSYRQHRERSGVSVRQPDGGS